MNDYHEQESFTDIVITVDGNHGIDDPVILDILEPALALIENEFGDVLFSSSLCSLNGETFRTVSAERDGLRAALDDVRPRAWLGLDRELHDEAEYRGREIARLTADLTAARAALDRVRAVCDEYTDTIGAIFAADVRAVLDPEETP